MRQRKKPLRKCVACQNMVPKNALIRIVRTSNDDVQLDPTGKVSGRGAYLCLSEECWGLAQKKKSLERSLRKKIPEDIYLQLTAQYKDKGAQSNEP